MRQFEVVVNTKVEDELQNAIDYFFEETGSHDLGKRLIESVETRLKDLENSALQYQLKYKEFRSLVVHPFSYNLYFRVDEDRSVVFVETLLHMKQQMKF